MSLESKFKSYVAKRVQFNPWEQKDAVVKEMVKISEASANLFAAKNRRFPLSPSAALSCGRKLVYDLQDFFNPTEANVQPINIRQQRVFRWGHIIEEFEINQINQLQGFQVTHQQEKFDIAKLHGFSVVGSIDGIVWHLPTRTPYLTDMKSINSYGFKEVEKTGFPKIGNFAQVNMYLCSPGYNALMDELKVPKEKRKGMIFYSNKDNQSFDMIEFEPDYDIFKATIDRFEKVYNAFKNEQIPPRDFVKTKFFPCGGYCPHASKCMGDGAGFEDPDLRLEVTLDLNLDADEEDLIYTLWQRVGTSSTYIYQDKLLRIKRLETKWQLKVEDLPAKEGAEDEVKKVKAGRKTRSKKKAKKSSSS